MKLNWRMTLFAIILWRLRGVIRWGPQFLRDLVVLFVRRGTAVQVGRRWVWIHEQRNCYNPPRWRP